jgi:hypothetical protein
MLVIFAPYFTSKSANVRFIPVRFILAAVILITSFDSFAQPCPGFQSGNPGNSNYTIDFYDNNGTFIKSCNCQLTGNSFKCGSCKPTTFLTYEFIFGGVPVNCVNVNVLPVELRHFNAVVTNGDVELVWSTETETDNAEFIIERSEDAQEYTFFAQVPGAGNSTVPLNYSLSDTDPLRGITYYRISQRDVNGTVTQLSIVSVELTSALSGTVIAPNPSQGKTMLQLPLHSGERMYDVVVYDELGKIVRSFQTTEDMPLELTNGVYRVVVLSGMQSWSEKVVITG